MEIRNLTYMFYGFSAAYLVLAGYVISLIAREGKIKRQLEIVKKMIEDREAK